MGMTKSMKPERAAKIARQLLKQAVKVLRAGGYTWEKAEEELKLRESSGMTAWRAAGMKHRKPGVTIGRAFRRSAAVSK